MTLMSVALYRSRKLHQQVTEGAVIINVQVRTTASKEAATTQLMETAIASGAFTKVSCPSILFWLGNLPSLRS